MRRLNVTDLEKRVEGLPSLVALDAEIANRTDELERLKTMRHRIARAQGQDKPVYAHRGRRSVRGTTTRAQVIAVLDGLERPSYWWEIKDILIGLKQDVAADNVRNILSLLDRAGEVVKDPVSKTFWRGER